MEVGAHLPTQGPLATREALLGFATAADRQGIASLWVSDHVVFPRSATWTYSRPPFAPDRAYLEPVAVLAAAAVVTTRARLGSSVFILGHRPAVVMAKMLTTIDALSNGRLIVGVGVGWWKEEFEALGAPFHARGRQADEALRVFKALWTSERPTFEGEFFRFRDVGFAPKPVQTPHPPLWIGGDSAAAFRRVVALGDGWHATNKTPAQFREALERLRAAAHAAGRAFETIELSLRFTLTDELLARGPQAVVDLLGEYARLGARHVMLEFRRDDLSRMLEILGLVTGTIAPALRAA